MNARRVTALQVGLFHTPAGVSGSGVCWERARGLGVAAVSEGRGGARWGEAVPAITSTAGRGDARARAQSGRRAERRPCPSPAWHPNPPRQTPTKCPLALPIGPHRLLFWAPPPPKKNNRRPCARGRDVTGQLHSLAEKLGDITSTAGAPGQLLNLVWWSPKHLWPTITLVHHRSAPSIAFEAEGGRWWGRGTQTWNLKKCDTKNNNGETTHKFC